MTCTRKISCKQNVPSLPVADVFVVVVVVVVVAIVVAAACCFCCC